MTAMCGNGNATLTDTGGADFMPSLIPPSHVSTPNSIDFEDSHFGNADPYDRDYVTTRFMSEYRINTRVAGQTVWPGSSDLAGTASEAESHEIGRNNVNSAKSKMLAHSYVQHSRADMFSAILGAPKRIGITPDAIQAGHFQSPQTHVLPEAVPGTGISQVSAGDDVQQEKQTNPANMDLLSRGGLTLSGGYSSVEGPNAGVKITRSNIGGFNREFSASARYSKIQSLIELSYSDGAFLGSRVAFTPTLFANRQSDRGFGSVNGSIPFRQSGYGVNFNFNRKFARGLTASGNYRLSADWFEMRGKNAICDNSIFGSSLCDALGKSTRSVLSFALTLDHRDSAIDPTKGFKLRLTQDVAGLGGTTRFARTRLGGSVHFGVTGGWNLSIGAEGGIITGIGGRDIPPFERFYMGGNSMRGFDLRSIGPKVRPTGASPSQSVAVGGRAYYAVRAELSLPATGLFGKFQVRPCVFVDAGSVFGARQTHLLPGETLIGNSAKPRVAIGVGLALNTPAGKLRFDFAKPVVQQAGDRSRMLSISFGAAI